MISTILADNAGPFTGPGTQSHVFGDEKSCVVIDPGPALEAHYQHIMAATQGRHIDAILLTHRHGDHAEMAPFLAERLGVPILAYPINPDQAWRAAPSRFHDQLAHHSIKQDDKISVGNFVLQVHHTPGHCFDHVAFEWCGEGKVFVGDTVMGWSSTAIIQPEGSMEEYRGSMRKLYRLHANLLIPTHGDPIKKPQERLEILMKHRQKRELEIFDMLDDKPQSLADLRLRIYPNLPENLYGGAETSIMSHLLDMKERELACLEESSAKRGAANQPDPNIWEIF
ncbi:MAG: MBL fold metallo-hydrolase [SAR116 cluster bacterium]|nr:MAG: MBL fold metallo-hydrolase [SAR116 cluster bacterium]HCJ61119.1 hypothetical protein [Alphaproteobacteria bacterium]|tara:strand:+ start:932 stop:1780 length:849 start_codon:yes stop_codon:yes gene_type:complete